MKSVFSMLADMVVFSGTDSECDDYIKENETYDNQLYKVGHNG